MSAYATQSDEERPFGERLLTARQLGEYLGLSPATVLDRFQRGDLPGFRLFGARDARGRPCGPVRFRLSEVESVLESWRADARGEAPTTP